MKSLISFIDEGAEEKKEEKYRILVISAEAENDELFHTAQRITDEAKILGHIVYVVKVEGASILFKDGVYKIYNIDDKEGFELNSKDTIAIVRGTVRLKKSWLDLLTTIEKTGATMVNSRETIEITADKYRSYVRLQDFGLTQPKTAIVPSPENWRQALKSLNTKFPIIMKTLEGSKGIGVLFVESERSLESLIQLLYNQNEDADLLIQEYIKTDKDIRVLILNDTVVAAMSRGIVKGDFRSNFSQGAEVKKYKLSALETEQSLIAAKAVGGVWTAVDFIPSQQPEKEPPYILEVNHSPGTKGIESTGVNVVKDVLVYFQNPKNRHPVALEVGRFERVELVGLGMIVANFDTGNSARAIIHSDDWKVKNKKVIWKTFGKTFEHDLVEMRHFEQGKWSWSSKTPIERPVIHLDVEFNGTKYTNVQFLIDDRGHKTTKCLMNQRFMRRSNIMINPAKTFVVSTKHGVEPDGTFKDDAFNLFN
jgi:RimK family alpha-L-glutamate ligase